MLEKENSFPRELEFLSLVRTTEVDAYGFWPWQHQLQLYHSQSLWDGRWCKGEEVGAE